MKSLMIILGFGLVGAFAQAKPYTAVYVLVSYDFESMANCPRTLNLKPDSLETGEFIKDDFSSIDKQDGGNSSENEVVSVKANRSPGKDKAQFVIRTKRSGNADIIVDIDNTESRADVTLNQKLDGPVNGPLPLCHNAQYQSKGSAR